MVNLQCLRYLLVRVRSLPRAILTILNQPFLTILAPQPPPQKHKKYLCWLLGHKK